MSWRVDKERPRSQGAEQLVEVERDLVQLEVVQLRVAGRACRGKTGPQVSFRGAI
jgi:hypothetical protein